MSNLYRYLYDFDGSQGIKAKQDAKISMGVWPQPDQDYRGVWGWWVGVTSIDGVDVMSFSYPVGEYNSPQFATGYVVAGEEPVPYKISTGFTYNYNEAYGKGVYLAGEYEGDGTTTQLPTTTEILPDWLPLFEFWTTHSGSFNYSDFAPKVSLSGGPWEDWKWDMGDGTTYYIQDLGGLPSPHVYADGSLKHVQVYYKGKDWTAVTTLYLYYLNLTGVLDISGLGCLPSVIRVSNQSLTKLIFKQGVEGSLANLMAHNNDLTEADLRCLESVTQGQSTIRYGYNPALTTITLPPTGNYGGVLGELSVNNCNLQYTELDLSYFDRMSTYGYINLGNQSGMGLKKVTFNPAITGNLHNMYLQSVGLTGTVDFSMFVNLTTTNTFQVYSNPDLTQILWPTPISGNAFRLYAHGTGISVMDLSSFPVWSTTYGCCILAYNCPNLTELIPPPAGYNKATAVWQQMWLQNCPLLTGLDLSFIENLDSGTAGNSGFDLNLYGNSGITAASLTFPSATTGKLYKISLMGTSFTGPLDLSWITGLNDYSIGGSGGGAEFHLTNLALTSIAMPIATGQIYRFRANGNDLGYINFTGIPDAFKRNYVEIWLQYNNMTSGEVDAILDDIATMVAAEMETYTTRTIDIGGTNAAPGATGLAAKTSLEAAGWSVTVTV